MYAPVILVQCELHRAGGDLHSKKQDMTDNLLLSGSVCEQRKAGKNSVLRLFLGFAAWLLY